MSVALQIISALIIAAIFSVAITFFGAWLWRRWMIRMFTRLAKKYSETRIIHDTLMKMAYEWKSKTLRDVIDEN